MVARTGSGSWQMGAARVSVRAVAGAGRSQGRCAARGPAGRSTWHDRRMQSPSTQSPAPQSSTPQSSAPQSSAPQPGSQAPAAPAPATPPAVPPPPATTPASRQPPPAPAASRPYWQRALWLGVGALSLLTGIVGVFLPVLPTTPFVLVAAFCFTRSSPRVERWLLEHRRFGPMVRDWRERRAVPLRAKQLAVATMIIGSAWAWWTLPSPYRWLPALVCVATGTWLLRLPTAPPRQ